MNLSNTDDIFGEILEFLGGIGVGKLTDKDIAKIQEYLNQMGLEKKKLMNYLKKYMILLTLHQNRQLEMRTNMSLFI